MRGEHNSGRDAQVTNAGSSPHARGTQYTISTCHGKDGIIPACAGNTFFPDKRAGVHRDHPRMRGEHD